MASSGILAHLDIAVAAEASGSAHAARAEALTALRRSRDARAAAERAVALDASLRERLADLLR